MKIARFLASFLLLLLAAVFQLQAQCNYPIPTGVAFGAGPTELPCLQRGNVYHEFITVYATSNVGIISASFSLDSIGGLPDGITYQIHPGTSRWSCVELNGVTFDSLGSYTIEIYGNFQLSATGMGNIFNRTGRLSDFCNAACVMCFPTGPGCPGDPVIQVINPGDNCCALNSQYSRLKGNIYFDVNANGSFDSTDYPMGNQKVLIDSAFVFSNASGEFEYGVLTGHHSISMDAPSHFSLTTNPPSYSLNIQDTCDAVFSGFDFGLAADTSIDDVNVSLNIGLARPGFQVTHYLSYGNFGTTILSDTIILEYDTELTFLSSSHPFVSHAGNELKWTYSALVPGTTRFINVGFQLPADTALLNDTLNALASIGPADSNPANNTRGATRIITGSVDPNEKALAPESWKSGMSPDSTMQYTIYFQNTGNDTAFTVEIRDTLDEHLDFSTFRHLGESHPVSLTVRERKYLTWTFYNILLPDSHRNEPGSHGFVSFDIQPLPGLQHGLLIENNAAIYFDYNPPVITNTTTAKILYSCPVQLPDTVRICEGNPVHLQAVSSESLNHLWNTGDTVNSITVNPLRDKRYSVTASNPYGCADTASVWVKVLRSPSLFIQPEGSEICTEGTATLIAQGGFTYLWNTGDTASGLPIFEPAVYSVTATDEFGCSDSASVTISFIGDVPIADFNFILSNDTVRFENLGFDATDDYYWTFGGIATSIDAQPEHIFSPGSYKVCLFAANVCGVDSTCKTVTVTATGGSWQTVESGLEVYTDDFNLHVQSVNSVHTIRSLRLFSAAGQEVLSMQFEADTQSAIIKTADLTTGIYLCSIKLSSGEQVVRKISIR